MRSPFVSGFVPLLFLVLLWASCSSTKNVTHDYDKAAPFESYRTFKIVRPTAEDLTRVPNVQERDLVLIEKLMKEEMEKKGYQVGEEPDLLLGYYIRSQRGQSRAYSTGVTVGGGFGGPYMGVGYSVGTHSVNYVDYIDGTLVVDIIDRTDKKLVFHGAATETIKEEASNKEVDAAIKRAVRAIFWNYKWKVK